MAILNVHQAKTHLSKLLTRIEGGEEIVIARAGKPVAKLVPITARQRRVPGIDKGKVWTAPDFDEFTAEDERDWYGDRLRPRRRKAGRKQ